MIRTSIGRQNALFASALFLMTPGISTADNFGLTVEHDFERRLQRLDLMTVDLEEIAEIPTQHVIAMDEGPDGLVYGLELRGIDPPRLIALHPETGATDVIAELAITDPRGLAFGPDAQLWVAAGSSLHRIDRAGGAILESLTLDQELLALAGSAEHLYGFSGFWQLWTIDTSTGDLTAVAELSSVFLDSFDADFDSSGSMWILGAGTGPIMGTISTGLYEVPDPATGQAVEVFFQFDTVGSEDPRSRIFGLAVLPGVPSVVDVPALDSVGMVVLAMLLGIFGAVALKFRRAPAVLRDAGRRR